MLMMQYPATAGLPEPLGVSLDGDGINVAVHSANADGVAVSLFDAADRWDMPPACGA